jgi:hypothetical protein
VSHASSRILGTTIVAVGVLTALLGAQTANGPAERCVPSDGVIRQMLRERVDAQGKGVGIVVGVIEPEGARVVSYGQLDDGNPRQVDGDTVFEIGSMTKVFTALLLAEMVERGEVALTDPIAKYQPDGARIPERNGQPITILDVATHTSGLPLMPDGLPPLERVGDGEILRCAALSISRQTPAAAADRNEVGLLEHRVHAARKGTRGSGRRELRNPAADARHCSARVEKHGRYTVRRVEDRLPVGHDGHGDEATSKTFRWMGSALTAEMAVRGEGLGIRGEGASGALPEVVAMRLGFADVLGARPLGTLPCLERHGLPLTERVERLARRLMEEVLLARLVGDEAEALLRDNTLDGALG